MQSIGVLLKGRRPKAAYAPSPTRGEGRKCRSAFSGTCAFPLTKPAYWVPPMEPSAGICFVQEAGPRISIRRPPPGESAMSLGMILVIILIIFLLGGFSGRFGGYGYGMGHSGMGLGGVILIVLLILLLLGKL